MNIKTRVEKLEVALPTRKLHYFFIHFISPDGNTPELLGYVTTSRGREIRIMRVTSESVHDCQCRCKEITPLPVGNNAVILMAIYADS
jgi:hypothetical protein